MTDLLAYHVAKQQITDLRRTAGHTRLTSTARSPRALTNGQRLISRMLSRVSTALAIDQRTTLDRPSRQSQSSATSIRRTS